MRNSKELALAVAAILEEKIASDIRIYDISEVSTLADFMIVATCTSAPHLKALASELHVRLKQLGEQGTRECGDPESGWIVFDAFDVVVHLFVKEMRDYYKIEELWPDAKIVDATDAAEEAKPAKTPRSRKTTKKADAGDGVATQAEF